MIAFLCKRSILEGQNRGWDLKSTILITTWPATTPQAVVVFVLFTLLVWAVVFAIFQGFQRPIPSRDSCNPVLGRCSQVCPSWNVLQPWSAPWNVLEPWSASWNVLQPWRLECVHVAVTQAPVAPTSFAKPDWLDEPDETAQISVYLATGSKLLHRDDAQPDPPLKDPASVSRRDFRLALQDSIANGQVESSYQSVRGFFLSLLRFALQEAEMLFNLSRLHEDTLVLIQRACWTHALGKCTPWNTSHL